MKYIVYSLTVILITALLISCSSGASSPEQLGRKVFNALKYNDVAGYLRLCGNSNDLIIFLKNSDLSKEKKEREIRDTRERKKEIDKKLNEKRRDNFARVHDEYQWKNLKVGHVELGKIKDRDGMEFYRDIRVFMTNYKVLEIDAIVKSPRGWLIMDDVPLSVD